MDDDDDFGDFGGFETADPTEAENAAAVPEGITATTSPWAVYTAAAVQGVSDDSALTASATGKELEATAATPSGDEPALPEVAVPTPETVTPAQAAGEGGDSLSVGSSDSGRPWPTEKEESTPKPIPLTEDSTEALATSALTMHAPNSPRVPPVAEGGQAPDTEVKLASLKAVQTHRDNLIKDLERMSENQARWNRELSECKNQLEQQVVRYDQLQMVHADSVTDMRKAGHDALAAIVAEYQELSKTTLAQQKQASQHELLVGLEEHNTRWQHDAKQQEELMKAALEEMKSKMADQLKEALKTQRVQLQEELQSVLSEERENHKADLQQALESQHEASKAALEVALRKEREKLQGVALEEKVKLQALLEEERLKSASAIKKTLAEERSRCQDCMDVALGEERRHSERHAQQIMEKAQREMRAYLHQQQQADMAVRQRALTTMDLFLEGTRKQLGMLLNQPAPQQPALTEIPPPDTLTPSL